MPERDWRFREASLDRRTDDEEAMQASGPAAEPAVDVGQEIGLADPRTEGTPPVEPPGPIPNTPASVARARMIEAREMARLRKERDEMGTIREPVCYSCKRLITWPFCEAYPAGTRGIPHSIRLGARHHWPRGDDWGLVQEPWSREDVEASEYRYGAPRALTVDEIARLEEELVEP